MYIVIFVNVDYNIIVVAQIKLSIFRSIDGSWLGTVIIFLHLLTINIVSVDNRFLSLCHIA